MKSLRISLVLSLVGLLTPGLMAQSQMQQAPPGTVNYVEGAVTLDGQPLSSSAVGSKVMQPGEVLSTSNGRAEILLTPGVFLRVGHNSAVQMVTPELMKTQVRVTNGRVSVEVDSLYKQNNIEIAQDGVMTRLERQGLYEFNANDGLVRTYQGRAMVFGSGTRPVKVGTSHELTLPVTPAAGGDAPVGMQELKSRHFDRNRAEDGDPLMAWSRLRSHYLSQANAQLAYEYAGYPGFVPGWYWNPWGVGYTWLPGNGMFWNPFGWGFYSPIWMSYGYYNPYYGGYGYGVARNSPSNGGRITAGRNFNPGATWRGGPRQSFQGQPARGFGGGAGFGGGRGGAGFGGGNMGGGVVSPGAGGFGGHVAGPAAGGHGH